MSVKIVLPGAVALTKFRTAGQYGYGRNQESVF